MLFRMIPTLRGKNLSWIPRNLVQPASRLDPSSNYQLIRSDMQNLDASMDPAFHFLEPRWTVRNSCLSNHHLLKNGSYTDVMEIFALVSWFTLACLCSCYSSFMMLLSLYHLLSKLREWPDFVFLEQTILWSQSWCYCPCRQILVFVCILSHRTTLFGFLIEKFLQIFPAVISSNGNFYVST